MGASAHCMVFKFLRLVNWIATKVKKNVYVNSEFIFALGSKVERWSRDHDPFLSAEISARSFVSLLSEKISHVILLWTYKVMLQLVICHLGCKKVSHDLWNLRWTHNCKLMQVLQVQAAFDQIYYLEQCSIGTFDLKEQFLLELSLVCHTIWKLPKSTYFVKAHFIWLA